MDDLTIRAAPPGRRALVGLRVSLSDAPRAAAAVGLPCDPLCWSGHDPAALWIGPDQWLLIGERLQAEDIVSLCQKQLGVLLHAATDLSDALDCIVIEGSGARDLLAMGSGVDFHPLAFRSGNCVRTRIAKLAIIIRAVDNERFEVIVDRSARRYLLEYLERSARDARALLKCEFEECLSKFHE
jgi:sarcosine oxidase, subunit gamma